MQSTNGDEDGNELGSAVKSTETMADWEYWEMQFRRELYPSPIHEELSDEEENSQTQAGGNEQNSFFDDSDDEDLESLFTFDNSATQTASCSSASTSKPTKNSVEVIRILDSDDSDSEFDPQETRSPPKRKLKRNDIQPSAKRPKLILLDDDENDPSHTDESFQFKRPFAPSKRVFDSSTDSEISQSKESTEDSEADSSDFSVVSQWQSDSQLDEKIAANSGAQRIIRKRQKKACNGFIDDEAGDAFDHEECFGEENSILDTSLEDFIDDEQVTASQAAPSDYHIRSLMPAHQDHHQMPSQFRLKPNPNIEVLPDTDDEYEDDEENEYAEDSFVCDEIVFAERSPTPEIQTQEMRLRSRRCINRRNQPPNPPTKIDDEIVVKKTRRRRVIIEDDSSD